MRMLLISLLALLHVLPAQAQTPCASPCVVEVGKAFSVLADHDGVNTTGYRLYLDNVKVGADIPMSALVAGTVTISAGVGPARGSHTVQLAAFNADGETRGVAFPFTTKLQAPTAPTNQRIIIGVTLRDGTITLEVLSVETLDPITP